MAGPSAGDSGHLKAHNNRGLDVTLPRYNADRTGAADATQALKDALSDAAGDRMFLPDGTYLCSEALTLDTTGTEIVGAGRAIIQFTGATDGLDVTAHRCRLENITLRAGHTGCVKAIDVDNAHYLSLVNVNIDRVSGMSWDTGIDLVNAQNVHAFGGQINAHDAGTGTIDNLIIIRNPSRGNTFIGVSLKGRNNAGEYTARGVQVVAAGGVFWFGGVIQGGFSTAAVDVDGGGSNPQTAFYSPHVEVTGGGGVGYRYDGSSGAMTVLAPRGGSILIGPDQDAWDFALYGGLIDEVTLGANAKTPTIAPAQINGSITDNGATDPRIGSFRTSGDANPGPETFRVLEGYEIADPSAPDSGHGVLYFRDNGSGKTQLCARFPTGAVQVVATEP